VIVPDNIRNNKRESGEKPELYPQLYALLQGLKNSFATVPNFNGVGRRFNPGRARKPAKISNRNILLPGKELMLRAIFCSTLFFLSC
jgi:hypothetical protein